MAAEPSPRRALTDPAHNISNLDALRDLYRQPSLRVQQKKGQKVTGAAADFVARSPFFCLASASPEGRCDVSPRGGPPGQIKILGDGEAVAFPDLSGNNLIDSLTNIVANPQAGLLVMVPGSDETLRIDGSAALTTDPSVLDLWANELRRPKLAVVVDVEAVFLHCAKAFRRSSLWDPDSWSDVDPTEAPRMFNAVTSGDSTDPSAMREFLEADYEATLTAERPG